MQSTKWVLAVSYLYLTIALPGCAADPDDPVVNVDEPCYRGLADLSGDGVLDVYDCDLRGTGTLMRQWCIGDEGAARWPAWRHMPHRDRDGLVSGNRGTRCQPVRRTDGRSS